MPTNNSSTLWLIPGEVSMYLQPNFVASDFPAEIKMQCRVAEINLDFFFVLCKLALIYEISTFRVET